MRPDDTRRRPERHHGPWLLLILPAVAFLAVFYMIPISWVVRVSFYEQVPGVYMVPGFTLDHYRKLVTDVWYLKNALWLTLKIAVGSTLAALVLAYPPALLITRSRGRLRQLLITAILAPLLISMISLIFGWILLFRSHGLVNRLLLASGLVQHPIQWMYNPLGVTLALVYLSVPYVVLPLLDSLQRIDPSWEEAARNAGANGWQTFFRVTLPLSIPGAVSGLMIALTLNISAFAAPLLLGGERVPMAGLLAYQQALELNDMPMGSAISVMLLIASVLVVAIFQKAFEVLYLKRIEAR